MGQTLFTPLPLPNEIPRPDEKMAAIMKESGIVINGIDNEESGDYLTYDLPCGWKMVDASYRQDIPIFHIVDANDMIKFTVSGQWKGTYDNRLRIRQEKEPTKYVPREEDIIPSKTSGIATIVKIGEALNQ